MPVSLRSELLVLTDLQDSDQLKALEECLTRALLTGGLSHEDKAALLEVFERFPDEDGFGVFWSILHGLEHVDDYEDELVQSVRRRPGLFNTLMLNRMLNAGIELVAGESIDGLLRELLSHPAANDSVVKQVQGFIDRREARRQ
jgi:hypothetical protein